MNAHHRLTGQAAEILGVRKTWEDMTAEEILARAEKRLTELIARRGIDAYTLTVCKVYERQYDMAKVVNR